jgi:hypothetical protein
MESCEELYFRLLNELEKLARLLIEVNFTSIQELWQIEIDLINYQSALQQAIDNEQARQREVKGKKVGIVSTRPEGWIALLQQLDAEAKQAGDRIKTYQHAYQLSRRLGDAFAWALLGDWLVPLTKKPSEPTHDGHGLPREHGLKGILAIAESLCAAGAGFPILHDMTNCLCTGDITFYSPDGNHTTIEVKTHLKEQSGGLLKLDVETHFPALLNSNEADKWRAIHDHIPKLPSPVFTDEIDEQVAARPRRQLDRRLKRQFERMRQAKIWQSMPTRQMFELDDRHKGISIDHQQDAKTYNWEIVLDPALKARANGIASCAVENAFVYTAIYENCPLTYPWLQGLTRNPIQSSDSVTADTLSILYPISEKEKNRLWVPVGVPPSDTLPFFLYPLPTDVIIDIMWGRLAIAVVANLGKIVAALEAIGLDAKVPESKKEFEQFFLFISTTRSLANNQFVKMELHQMHTIGLKMIFEFLSLQGFVRLVSEMVQATEAQAITQREQA